VLAFLPHMKKVEYDKTIGFQKFHTVNKSHKKKEKEMLCCLKKIVAFTAFVHYVLKNYPKEEKTSVPSSDT